MNHFIVIPFLFAFGACVGSFLNVVVWRLPRDESLVTPRSRCPKCGKQLAWYDNIPIFGWISLGGKCRYCGQSISMRYPIIETITALLFVLYYVCFFILQIGPCPPDYAAIRLAIELDWPIYFLYMALISALLAASLIDAELFIIPLGIPWLMAVVGIAVHAIIDHPSLPGALSTVPAGMALAAGAGLGFGISLLLWKVNIIPTSFPEGEPLLEVDRAAMLEEIETARREGRKLDFEGQVPPSYTKGEIRQHIGREMVFLMPPLVLGALSVYLLLTIPAMQRFWIAANEYHWLGGLCGSLLGAMIGAFVVWLTRILGTLAFGRVAMGLGDVHLMFGVGAVIGAGASTVAFFIAPFMGILYALWMLITRKRREVPYGPYLSLATAVVMIFYCQIAEYMTPGMHGLMFMLMNFMPGGGANGGV